MLVMSQSQTQIFFLSLTLISNQHSGQHCHGYFMCLVNYRSRLVWLVEVYFLRESAIHKGVNSSLNLITFAKLGNTWGYPLNCGLI